MFDVIDDKPEGFIMYKHEPVGRGFIQYHINHERVYVLLIRGQFAWGVYTIYSPFSIISGITVFATRGITIFAARCITVYLSWEGVDSGDIRLFQGFIFHCYFRKYLLHLYLQCAYNFKFVWFTMEFTIPGLIVVVLLQFARSKVF